jgi:hypothetical protein
METGSWTDAMDVALERLLAEASKIDDVCKYFKYTHLPAGALRDTSRTFAYQASEVLARAPRCPQRTHALNHLLLAKDAAVRACLP